MSVMLDMGNPGRTGNGKTSPGVVGGSEQCPTRRDSPRMETMVKSFYGHLARLIYAEAVGRRPMHVAQLREQINAIGESHHVAGAVVKFASQLGKKLSRRALS